MISGTTSVVESTMAVVLTKIRHAGKQSITLNMYDQKKFKTIPAHPRLPIHRPPTASEGADGLERGKEVFEGTHPASGILHIFHSFPFPSLYFCCVFEENENSMHKPGLTVAFIYSVNHQIDIRLRQATFIPYWALTNCDEPNMDNSGGIYHIG